MEECFKIVEKNEILCPVHLSVSYGFLDNLQQGMLSHLVAEQTVKVCYATYTFPNLLP
jgi:hypothetical protein